MSAAEAEAELEQVLAPRPARSAVEPPNRRFRTSSDVSETAKTSSLESAYKAVGVACSNALISWPDAKAAILFGSRARGNHRADSDWDIAFITSSEEPMPGTIHEDLNKLGTSKEISIHELAISQNRFYENSNSFGNVAASIACEGRLISGQCKWPEKERKLILKPHEYESWRAEAMGFINSATEHLAKAIDTARRSGVSSEFKAFVRNSFDAAEYFAKIAFWRLVSSIEADPISKSHRVKEIVDMLDTVLRRNDEPNNDWWLSDHGTEIHDLLIEMNGHGRSDHQQGYEVSAPNDIVIARAASRLIATVCFAIREVEELPGPANLRPVALNIADAYRPHLHESADRLRQLVQNLDLNDSTFSAADPVLARSARVAVNFSEEIAQEIEKLANSFCAEAGSEDRAETAS